MSHFELEKQLNEAACMNAPITQGPLMRWQKKAKEIGKCGRVLNALKLSNDNVNTSGPSSNLSTTQNTSTSPGRNGGCRFIPNRGAMDMAGAQFISAQTNKEEDATSEKQKTMKAYLSDNIVPENCKILAFNNKPQQAPEGYLNHLRVLWSHQTPAQHAQVKSDKKRFIPSQPERILDAPCLLDDFYLNLVDWSSLDELAVALGQAVYLWKTSSGDTRQLMQCGEENDEIHITAVSWLADGIIIAVGLSTGAIQLWNAPNEKLIRTMTGHETRVGVLAWNNHILSSGTRTGVIFHHDVRIAEHRVAQLISHTQEVCGLKWSPNGTYLASGGNDNVVCIWDNSLGMDVKPLHTLSHQGAVKAVAWCPWNNNMLATGGGTSDRHIRFWNAQSGVCLKSFDSKSQVCALLWSKHQKELVSAHGFNTNQLTIWSYPKMDVIANLTGHSERILNLTMSPDGQMVLSASADETIRIWQCFEPKKTSSKPACKPGSKPSELFRSIR